MAQRWLELLRRLCKKACLDADSQYAPDVVAFYLARWCQKKARKPEPELEFFEPASLQQVAARIVRNLADDGVRVMRLAAGDPREMSSLLRLLLASARPRAGEAAPDFADEALSRIMIVLLTGTPPSRAAEELEQGPDGPRNEFVFHAPFEFWARRVVINLVIDDRRRAARERDGPPAPPRGQSAEALDASVLKSAHDALPALVEAIRRLPDAQRSAMAMSLCRPEVEEIVRERFRELGPDLFLPPSDELPSTDSEIAERLRSTPRRVTANRSLARRKLAERDARWELLLDELLPHASTRPLRPRQAVASDD